MAQMTVARALTKLKTVSKRIQDKLKFIYEYGGATSKTKSMLSNEQDIGANHATSRKAIAEAMQSVKDLQTYYTELTLAIQKSNLETEIQTANMGPITVARALVMAQTTNKFVQGYARSLKAAMAKAETLASQYNSTNVSGAIKNDLDPVLLQSILAQPVIFFDMADVTEATEQETFVMTELNSLINESNASTVIDVPDEI